MLARVEDPVFDVIDGDGDEGERDAQPDGRRQGDERREDDDEHPGEIAASSAGPRPRRRRLCRGTDARSGPDVDEHLDGKTRPGDVRQHQFDSISARRRREMMVKAVRQGHDGDSDGGADRRSDEYGHCRRVDADGAQDETLDGEGGSEGDERVCCVAPDANAVGDVEPLKVGVVKAAPAARNCVVQPADQSSP